MNFSREFFLTIALMVLFYPEEPEARPQDGGSGTPNWCDPTHPMGAWLNFAKIREICNGGSGGGGAADEGEPPAPPPPSADPPGGGDGGDGVPAWCDPTHAMGAWLNFEKIREKCKEMGFENFGPYGGK